ncbi:MAG: AAA family ATPase [Actinomycetota bacterium]
MQLRRLTVERFRGIRSLTWDVNGPILCLVGPGDATKTTILDAIEWTLWPRPMLSVGDADFHGITCDHPILIEATVGELPDRLRRDDLFGLELRGWSSEGELHDEPDDADEEVLTVRLTVDDSLDPTWEIVNDRRSEPRLVRARDREAFGVARLGPDIERHLTWARGSALSRVTADTDDVHRVLAAASRRAREMVKGEALEDLAQVADKATDAARRLGATGDEYRPAMDPGAATAGAGALALHQGDIPARLAGTGSRRLTALAVQKLSVPEGAIVLVDEVESGLEPHRLRHLLRELAATPDEGARGQVLTTTHSPVALTELPCRDLRIVRCVDGDTSIRNVPEELQGLVRAEPGALLCERLLVCEGKTELGIIRRLQRGWTDMHDSTPPEHLGVTIALGNGNEAPRRALALAGLGYGVALLADSDQPLTPDADTLEAAGVRVIQWDDGKSTELRVALDLPFESVGRILDVAAELDGRGRQRVDDALAARLSGPVPASVDPLGLLEAGFSEEDIRSAIGRVSLEKEWFKRIDWGEALGDLILEQLPQILDTDLARKLAEAEAWVYAP